jgi:AcrR family transcriptional regulator
MEFARRGLNPRQADTVARLVDAALEEVRAVGYDALTVRTVAARAEVAPATAYTYFASKNHLVVEVFWRALQVRPGPESDSKSAAQRVVDVFADLADFLGGEPALAQAVTVALLGNDPDVQQLRLLVGAEVHRRLAEAVGPHERRGALLEVLDLAWSGSMLNAGMGYQTYDQMRDQLARVVDVVMGGPQ